jgi:hypothetical protein
MSRIESDYEHIYESSSQLEIEAEMIVVLEKMQGCEVSAAIFKLASVTE